MNEPNNPNSPAPSTRRDFLKKTSTAVAGGALLGSLSVERGAHAAGSDTLRIALIGCGGRGSGAADQALSTAGSVKLIAMADAFKDRLDGSFNELKKNHQDKVEISDDHKFVGFDAYKHAIALADVVVLATPPGFRPIHFEEAVKQGKHIFMEKPVATDAPGVRRVLAAAEEAKKKNLKVGVGLQRHHQLGYIETLKRLHDGEIGDITAMRCYWNGTTPWVHPRAELEKHAGRKLTEMEYQMRNWYYFVWLCGDHIVEQHIHNLDVINWVKQGHPVRAQGMGGVEVRKGPDYGEIFDHHAVEFEYADGSRCFSYCRHINGCWSDVSEHVVGTKGSCHVGGGRGEHTMRDVKGESTWKFKGKGKDPYQQEHDDLFEAIRNNKPYNEAEYGAHSTMTAIFGRMATYSGKMIEWEDAINSKISVMPRHFAWDAEPPVKPRPDGWYDHAVPGKTVVI
ncbi:MAG: dehydrogenase [Verrucomicrobia bacterium]|nr:MAG: dehydrogenase [Verrucomicrobiota bacterium]PYK00259.1 MAG: dehydrogenase [Verrucomicrobiota bacterium]